MDRPTAEKVLKACSSAYVPLNAILQDRSEHLTDEEFVTLRHNVAGVLAHMFDLLIEPVIDQYPDLDVYRSR